MKKISGRIAHVPCKLIIFFVFHFILVTSCTKEEINVRENANKAPLAKAGNDTIISLPTDTVWVDGSASYDPDGSIVSTGWKKIAGPDGVSTFIADHVSYKIKLQFPMAGTYEFELTVTDNKNSVGKDTIQIIVNNPVNPSGLTGKEVIFENLVAQEGPAFNSIIHSIQYSTPARPDLFPDPHVPIDVLVKFDNSANWILGAPLVVSGVISAGYLTYQIDSSRLHIYDYTFNGRITSVKVRFR